MLIGREISVLILWTRPIQDSQPAEKERINRTFGKQFKKIDFLKFDGEVMQKFLQRRDLTNLIREKHQGPRFDRRRNYEKLKF